MLVTYVKVEEHVLQCYEYEVPTNNRAQMVFGNKSFYKKYTYGYIICAIIFHLSIRVCFIRKCTSEPVLKLR